ncbi:MAG: UPF0175 family protein [Gammaproteobacteria bacterium]|nr:UPF0175 family protein [Gammaproteobacteria bacterium]
MQITLNLPNDLILFEGLEKVKKEAAIGYALWLFKGQRVTLAKAAEIADESIYNFMQYCKEAQIPVIDIDKATLAAELL